MTEPRKLVDWEAVEADYRCGQLTLRQLGEKHGTKAPTIVRKAKEGGWTRDKSVEIDQRTRAALAQAAADEYVRNAEQNARDRGTKLERCSISAAEAAVALNVQIVEGQRKDIRKSRELLVQLMGEFDSARVDEGAEPGTRLLQFSTRVQTMQRLSATLKDLIAMERQAYCIGESESAGQAGWEGFLDEAAPA